MIISQATVSREHIKVRWEEPYVSAALNAKFFGIVPAGVYSGFKISAEGRSVRVSGGQFGPVVWDNLGYSVAVHYSSSGYATTVVVPAASGNEKVLSCELETGRKWVVLTISYVVGGTTEGSYKLVDAAFLAENPDAIVLGHVDIPLDTTSAITVGYDDSVWPRRLPIVNDESCGFISSQLLGLIRAGVRAAAIVGSQEEKNQNIVTHTSLQGAINDVQAAGGGTVLVYENLIVTQDVSIGANVHVTSMNNAQISGNAKITLAGVNSKLSNLILSGLTNGVQVQGANCAVEGCTFATVSQLTATSLAYFFRNNYGNATSQTDVTRWLARALAGYHAIVGSAQQVINGAATHTTISAAISDSPVNGKILILNGSYSENVSVAKQCLIEGQGAGSIISGTLSVSSSYTTVRNVKVTGNITVSGSGCFVRECFQGSAGTITDTGSANSKLVIRE